MSTPRWKAKEVKKQVYNKQYKTHKEVLDYFETEDGRRFYYGWSDKVKWNKDTQFYFLKTSNDYRYSEWRYWVYPIPWNMAVYTAWKTGELCVHYGYDKRHIVVEVK